MIIVRVELDSAVAESRDRLLGTVVICNVGSSTTHGDYEYELQRPGGRRRTGTVRGFPRKQKSALSLLRLCLNDLHDRGDLP